MILRVLFGVTGCFLVIFFAMQIPVFFGWLGRLISALVNKNKS